MIAINFFRSSSTEVDNGNRHLKEFSYSIKPNSTETKLLKFALSNKAKETRIAHPIDNIKSIEQKLFPILTTDPQNVAKIRKKARKLAAIIADNTSSNAVQLQSRDNLVQAHKFTLNPNLKRSSKWDIQSDLADNLPTKKVFTCLPQNYYTIRSGEIIKLDDKETKERNLVDLKKRLSVEEIRNLPKFKNFDKGTPSKVYFKQSS